MSRLTGTLGRLAGAAIGVAVVVACSDTPSQPGSTADELRTTRQTPRRGTVMQKQPRATASPMSLSTQDLTTLTPEEVAQTLVGPGVTISNVSYTGADVAGGTFAGGDGIIGFESGVVLSSGCVANVVGPNVRADMTCQNGTPGDPDLTDLAGFDTYDAAVLEFDFVPTTDRIFFQYVFASEEYNEWVGSDFNDVFAFYVNGVNYATVGDPPVAVTINTINEGQPGLEPTNPELYVNNDPFDPNYYGEIVPSEELLDTEMDGLTVVLTFEAPVNAGVANRMKLAIADGSDRAWDANVFIQAGTLAVCVPVALDRVWSDDGEPGTIDPGSSETFAAVFDVERFLPRPASPSDVRFSVGTVDETSWSTGIPAERYYLADLDQDGQRDVVTVFDTERLIDEGGLGTGAQQVTLWGLDPVDDALYCATGTVDVGEMP